MRTFLTQNNSINTTKIVHRFRYVFNYKLKSIQTNNKIQQKIKVLII
jgi:hypothetical protein